MIIKDVEDKRVEFGISNEMQLEFGVVADVGEEDEDVEGLGADSSGPEAF